MPTTRRRRRRTTTTTTTTLLLPLLLTLALLLRCSRAEMVVVRGGWNGRDDVEVERNATEVTDTEKMLAGSVARVAAQTLLHPLDVIRTRRQAAGVAQRYDVPTLLRGVAPQAILSLPAGAIQFGTLEYAKRVLREQLPDVAGAALVDLAAGSVGAFSASIVRVPQEVIKQGVQASLYDNSVQAARAIWGGPLRRPRKGVFARFYNGFLATLSRDIPWNALSYAFFMAFRTFYQKLTQLKASDPLSPSLDLAFGACGGALAAILTHPIDVVKTRIMTAKAGQPIPGDGYVLAGIVDLSRTEGPGVLARGLVPRVLFLAPLASIIFAVFENMKTRIVRAKVKAAVFARPQAGTGEIVEGGGGTVAEAARAAAAAAAVVEEEVVEGEEAAAVVNSQVAETETETEVAVAAGREEERVVQAAAAAEVEEEAVAA